MSLGPVVYMSRIVEGAATAEPTLGFQDAGRVALACGPNWTDSIAPHTCILSTSTLHLIAQDFKLVMQRDGTARLSNECLSRSSMRRTHRACALDLPCFSFGYPSRPRARYLGRSNNPRNHAPVHFTICWSYSRFNLDTYL